MLEIPTNTKTFELRSSIVWFDEDGIAYSVPRKNAPLSSTDEEIRTDAARFRNITGNKKVCLVIESDPSRPSPPRHQRDLLEQELNSIVKAMAIITTSAVSKMIANLFFSLKPPPYPMRMFTDEKEAIHWIREVNRNIDKPGSPGGKHMLAC